METLVRNTVGWIIFAIGVLLFLIGVRYYTDLWAGVRTKIVVKEVGKDTILVRNDSMEETGELRVEHRWHYVDKDCEKQHDDCAPSGEYQFRDKNNTISVMKFCSIPPPNIKQDSVVNITYTKRDISDCIVFVNAKIISEPSK